MSKTRRLQALLRTMDEHPQPVTVLVLVSIILWVVLELRPFLVSCLHARVNPPTTMEVTRESPDSPKTTQDL